MDWDVSVKYIDGERLFKSTSVSEEHWRRFSFEEEVYIERKANKGKRGFFDEDVCQSISREDLLSLRWVPSLILEQGYEQVLELIQSR